MNTIADAKELFFENKEQYLAFRKAWKAAANNPDIHLQAEHFMFYSAIRGRNCFEGFRDRGPKKAYTQGWANPGTSNAYTQLKYIARNGGVSFAELFENTISPTTVMDVISMIPKVSTKYILTSKPYEEWLDEYVSSQLAEFRTNLEASQTPLEPEFREALHQALQDSAELISEGVLVK